MEDSTTVWFAVKRLDLHDTDISDVISLSISKSDSASEVAQKIRSKLELNDDLIIKLRSAKGHLLPLNGKITSKSSPTRPLTLEVVQHFQSVEPEPNSVTLTQYQDAMIRRLTDMQERIDKLELAEKDMTEKRTERIIQEVSTLQNTVDFLYRRLDEAESVNWNGMFIRYPLW